VVLFVNGCSNWHQISSNTGKEGRRHVSTCNLVAHQVVVKSGSQRSTVKFLLKSTGRIHKMAATFPLQPSLGRNNGAKRMGYKWRRKRRRIKAQWRSGKVVIVLEWNTGMA